MKRPFNLEQFKAGRPAINRDGQEVHFVGMNPISRCRSDCEIIAVEGEGVPSGYRADGTYAEDRATSGADLIYMKSVTHTFYGVVDMAYPRQFASALYDAEAGAAATMLLLRERNPGRDYTAGTMTVED